jgi:hypothetical protein
MVQVLETGEENFICCRWCKNAAWGERNKLLAFRSKNVFSSHARKTHSFMTKMRLPEVQSSSRSGMQLHNQLFTLINQWSPADRLMWARWEVSHAQKETVHGNERKWGWQNIDLYWHFLEYTVREWQNRILGALLKGIFKVSHHEMCMLQELF